MLSEALATAQIVPIAVPPPGAPAPLPVEIIQKITSLLDSDSLQQCSVVSSTWRACAVRRLFNSVSLNTQRHIDSLTEVLQTNPALTAHIRTVVIGCNVPSSSLPLLRLPQVETLALASASFQCSVLAASIRWITDTFPGITQLILLMLSLCDNCDMPARLLLAYPRLSFVVLISPQESPPCAMPRSNRAVGNCVLQKLVLQFGDIPVIDSFNSPGRNILGFVEDFVYYQRRTSLSGQSGANSYDYRNSLSAVLSAATSLRNMSLAADPMDVLSALLEGVIERVDFSAHTALRMVELYCDPMEEDRQVHDPRRLLPLIRVTRAMGHRLVHTERFQLSINVPQDSTSWIPTLEALTSLPSPEQTSATELVLVLGDNTFTIKSLTEVEHVLETLL